MQKSNLKISIPIAILITLIAIIYQRTTGPTYPKRFKVETEVGTVKFKLPRSQENTQGASIFIPDLGGNLAGEVTYRRFPTDDPWHPLPLEKKDNHYEATLPVQPAAGKLQYFVTMKDDGGKTIHEFGSSEKPIMIRYKGPVSTYILAPHIFFMFFSMLLSALAGTEAMFGSDLSRKVGRVVLFCLAIGGMILGPMVQKSAFGVYWSGFPFDWDLTDNKLLVGFLAWLTAVILNLKVNRPKATLAAAVVLIAMYSIPHSMMGSQYDYKKGSVEIDRKKLPKLQEKYNEKTKETSQPATQN
jgi:hypothetical protein